jgi:dTDP-4-dehydrorhamnose 3,5-epimerase-like enzyme
MIMDRWTGLRASALGAMTHRNYETASIAERLRTSGATVAELLAADRQLLSAAWIPGVELIPRRIYRQRHRGFFGEFMREGEGVPKELGFWPRQWATARMFAGTCKGFHIHPPFIPVGAEPSDWFQHLYISSDAQHSERPYDKEQWDSMFFIQGNVEMLLVDERTGLERRVMRFFIEGDDSGGSGHAGVLIPPGVAHAIKVEGSADAIMVYGTTTVFDPEAEGRISDSVERAELPPDWVKYLERTE